MNWRRWADELRQNPQQAVADLLRGAADIGPFERATPHEFLLAIMPRASRTVTQRLLGEPNTEAIGADNDLPRCLDRGLAAWLRTQRQSAPPPARKLAAYVAQVCEALQWPLYFALPETRAALGADRALWLSWLGSLTLSAYRDPEYDYWQILASHQTDDRLQFFWHSFVIQAGRLRSLRYRNLGLLALAKLPLNEEDSLHNLRLQAQALIDRYHSRKSWGTPAQEELAHALRDVMARNPSMNADNYRNFLTALLSPLGENTTESVLGLLGLGVRDRDRAGARNVYKLEPPGLTDETRQAVQTVRQSNSLAHAWQAIFHLIDAHENFLHRSGIAYYFVRTLDECIRALCKKYPLRDPEIQPRVFQWIHLALRVDADDPRRWMLWELALRQADQPQRAQWVLWEMTRRFPDHLPCRVELARMLADSADADDRVQAHRLLRQVLRLDPDNLHAHSTLAQWAIRNEDWPLALEHATRGLDIEPSDGSCAVLRATAYERRNEPGDMQRAIDHLQRFVSRYQGNLRAESYLRQLQQRQAAAPTPLQNDKPARIAAVPPEADAAWRAFADSIHAWRATSVAEAPPAADSGDRLLPLPQALRIAITRGQWDSDALAHYDADIQREFPLETRLWRYLQILQTTPNERERTKQAVYAWLDAEIRACSEEGNAKNEKESWGSYLAKYRDALNASDDNALTLGAEWLKDLLDRHHPLPAPLLANGNG